MISGPDIEHVARIAVPGVAGCIDIMNDAIECSRFTPALVPPIGGAVVHSGKEVRSTTARPWEAGADIGVSPGVPAVGGSVDTVSPIAQAATHLIHRGDIYVACDEVAGNLHVAEKRSG